ncbi:histidine ammonia-lyase [Pseudoduganella plicata]|uniref:tyrosine ammonia-lyase n=1 Tax=Pseudoduganella plicata TaxID=321984 RepID=A0A4P7BJG6_9BURK|nr:aromatic amino acid ammonia-lyase [Pseudoduganella plicata]QBQ38402.1 aromatic amino acid lyase [Pseudoduganella plicata]GGY81809.1 histidine ammonia-lyase [Pseudoduganella plicata]
MKRTLTISQQRLTIEDIVDLSQQRVHVALSTDAAFQQRIKKGADFLDRLLETEGEIYGVTTGYGDSVTRQVSRELIEQLPVNLLRFHGCGLGEHFDLETSRAIMAARLVSLSRGYSGVTPALLQQLASMLEHDIIPLIPQEGSVGASGDLTPLSYVAAAMIGEREVRYRDQVRPSAEVLAECGLTPLRLRPKEGLAMMNGTAVMTALACLAFKRAEYLSRLCTRTTALAAIALKSNLHHFDEDLFKAKPHPGLQRIAALIRADLMPQHDPAERLQDRYSIRCAPHVIGVLEDSMAHFRSVIENELNSANDNPLLDPEKEKLLHGGHFYGGHIAHVMDTLKTQIANLADLMDRQLALLVDTRYNNGMTANLSLPDPSRASINHGFKAVQIGVSAWTAEALQNCMPASVFSRSTECHNQDKVSMGTIAARSCIRVIELVEQVQAAMVLAATQAIAVRRRVEPGASLPIGLDAHGFIETVEAEFALVGEDRPLEADLRRFIAYIREQRWTFPA